MVKQLYGEDHPNAASCLNNLAGLLEKKVSMLKQLNQQLTLELGGFPTGFRRGR